MNSEIVRCKNCTYYYWLGNYDGKCICPDLPVVRGCGFYPKPDDFCSYSKLKIELKDYYTIEEVDKFTKKDYDENIGLWEKVRESMLKW